MRQVMPLNPKPPTFYKEIIPVGVLAEDLYCHPRHLLQGWVADVIVHVVRHVAPVEQS